MYVKCEIARRSRAEVVADIGFDHDILTLLGVPLEARPIISGVFAGAISKSVYLLMMRGSEGHEVIEIREAMRL